MAKHKSQRALFDLLAKERGGERAKGEAAVRPAPVSPGGSFAGPVVRTAGAPQAEVPVPVARPPAAAPRTGGIADLRLSVNVYHLAVAVVAVLCLCVFFYCLGRSQAGPALPSPPKEPTFSDVRQSAVAPDLVRPDGRRSASGGAGASPPGPSPGAASGGPAPSPPRPAGPAPPPRPAGGPSAGAPSGVPRTGGDAPAGRPAAGGPAVPDARTPTPAAPKAPAAPTGPLYRVRIARLSVSQPDVVDRLRGYLVQQGIETDLETRGGFHVLYSRQEFPDRKKSDDLAERVNGRLEEFEKQTRTPTSKDAYSIQVTKE